MSKRNKILTVFGTAVVTFGILFATLGAQRFEHRHYGHHHHHECSQDVDEENK